MLQRAGGARLAHRSLLHEHYDGSGYPDGLAGEGSRFEARIITYCDVFSAMTTTRSYRKALPMGAALTELRANARTQFDSRVAEERRTGTLVDGRAGISLVCCSQWEGSY